MIDTASLEKLEALEDDRIKRKVKKRVVPFLIVITFMHFLEQINYGNVQEVFMEDNSITISEYGIGIGVMYITFLLFSTQSEYILKRIGGSLNISR